MSSEEDLRSSAQLKITLKRGESHLKVKAGDRSILRRAGAFIKEKLGDALGVLSDKLKVSAKLVIRKIKDMVSKAILDLLGLKPGSVFSDIAEELIVVACDAAVEGFKEGVGLFL